MGSSRAGGDAVPDASVVARLSSLPGVHTASGVAEAAEDARSAGEVLPVASELASVLPRAGLHRGSTLAVHGSTSLLLALLAEATAAGFWAAVVGMPNLGVLAASELGVRLSRLGLVPRPGGEFSSATAALLDGMDLVAVAPPGGRADDRLLRRLSARARSRGAVLLSSGAWPGADLELRCVAGSWSGAEGGAGHLRERRVAVEVTGRGSAARPVRTELYLPASAGRPAPCDAAPSERRVPQRPGRIRQAG